MWDFSFRTSLILVARTLPFILLRLVVYVAIALGYVGGIGVGIGAGWAIGRAFDDGELLGATIGGFAGFFLVAGFLWWIRQYIFYIVKAGHVCALDALLHGRPFPAGQGQIRYAADMVKARFLEVNLLFAVDLMVRGVIRALTGILSLFIGWVPDGGQITRFVKAVLRVVLGLVDEVILAYIIRAGDTPPTESARDGLVLYAQNASNLLKNGIWIALFEYLVAILIFLILLGPVIGIAYAMPGDLSAFGVVFAAIFAWCLKRALVEPISIACLLQAYDRAIAGQTPNPEWVARLDQASSAFRQLGGTAFPTGSAVSGQPVT